MLKRIFYQINRNEWRKNFFLINPIFFVNPGFDPEIEKRINLYFIDLNQIHGKIQFLLWADKFVAALVQNIVQDIGQFVQGNVGLVSM